MILGFHTKQLLARGTEVALFDYALGSKELLGHEVRIFVPSDSERLVSEVRQRFAEHFELVLYDHTRSIACDALYVIKRGRPGRHRARRRPGRGGPVGPGVHHRLHL